MPKYKTLKDVVDAVKRGKLDESQICIILDNDFTLVKHGEMIIYEGNGYYDIKDLYPLLFPKAKVEWC